MQIDIELNSEMALIMKILSDSQKYLDQAKVKYAESYYHLFQFSADFLLFKLYSTSVRMYPKFV